MIWVGLALVAVLLAQVVFGRHLRGSSEVARAEDRTNPPLSARRIFDDPSPLHEAATLAAAAVDNGRDMTFELPVPGLGQTLLFRVERLMSLYRVATIDVLNSDVVRSINEIVAWGEAERDQLLALLEANAAAFESEAGTRVPRPLDKQVVIDCVQIYAGQPSATRYACLLLTPAWNHGRALAVAVRDGRPFALAETSGPWEDEDFADGVNRS